MRIRDLYKLPYGRDWLWEKLALVGRTMLSKSLVQFSANGWDCAPCLYFDLRSLRSLWGLPYSTLCGGLMAASSKRTYANMLCFSGLLLPLSLTLWQATVDPPTPLPETPKHRQIWLSLLWGRCTFHLGPGAHRVLFVPSKESLVSPVLWKFCNQILLTFIVRFPGDSQSLCWIPKLRSLFCGPGLSQVWELFDIFVLQFVDHPSGGYVVRLMAASSRGLMPHIVPPRTAATSALVPVAATADPHLRRRLSNIHRQVWLSLLCGSLILSWVLVCTKFCLCPPKVSGRYEVWLNMIAALLLSHWSFTFVVGQGVSSFGGFQCPPVDGCSAARCDFGVPAGDKEHRSFYSVLRLSPQHLPDHMFCFTYGSYHLFYVSYNFVFNAKHCVWHWIETESEAKIGYDCKRAHVCR